MLERFVVIGSATVLAVVVLVLTLLSQPSDDPMTTRQTIDEPVNVDLLPGFDPARSVDRLDGRGQINQYRLNSMNSRGQLVELFGDTLTPLPNGVTRVTGPGARIHLAATRLLEIRAVEGTVIAPDNQLRSGEFVGDVVVTLFECLPGRQLDLSPDSADTVFHIDMQDARFDLELGQIESDRDVHLTGPRVDFRGVGLSLIYNELRNRVDRLEVARGQSLRLIPAAPKTAGEASLPDDTPSTQPASGPPSIPTVPTDTATAVSSEDHPTFQYYRARFEDQVRVRGPQVAVDADRLEVVFAMGSGSDRAELLGGVGWDSQGGGQFVPIGHRATVPVSRRFRTAGLNQSSGAAMTLLPVNTPPGLLAHVLAMTFAGLPVVIESDAASQHATEGPNEGLEIVWVGRMTVEPEPSPPIDMSGPDDYLVQLIGRPVRVTTQRGQAITAASVDYLASEGRARMIGSDAYPLEIESPQMGTLHGQRLVIHEHQGLGQIHGSGQLVVRGGQVASDEPDSSDDLTVAWRDHVDLSFYLRDGASDAPGRGGRIEALKEAVFRGGVHAQHPQFDLDCDGLTVGLVAPTSQQQNVRHIEAAGHVKASVAPAEPDAVMEIQSDVLTVQFTDDTTGGVEPSSMLAVGHVEARQGVRVLQAGRLEAVLDRAGGGTSAMGGDDPPEATAAAQGVAEGSHQDLTLATSDTPSTTTKPTDESASFAQQWVIDQPPEVGQVGADDPSLGIDPLVDPVSQVQAPSSADRAVELGGFGADPLTRRVAIRSVTIQQDVRVDMPDLAVRATADRMVADAAIDQIELFGTPDKPARIDRADGTLNGGHVIINQVGQSVHVAGAGTLTFASVSPKTDDQRSPAQKQSGMAGGTWIDADKRGPDDDAGPAAPPAAARSTGARARVSWNQAMHFDNRFGLAQFIGDVSSDASTAGESSQLTAQDLRVEFTELEQDPSAALSAGGQAAQGSGGDNTRVIRLVTARDDVVFQSTKWADDARLSLETRLRVAGPLVSFDNVVEQVQVIGPGRMLLEDYRVRSERRRRDPSAAALFGVERSGRVRLTGRGATLLRWTGQLLLDAFHNDIRVDTGVQMIHRSLDSQLTVQLDCRRLLADLEATGGLGVWFAGDSPQPQVKAIYADGDVRVLSDPRTVTTDHLEYTDFDQTILLRADEGRLTQIDERDRPTPLSAQRFRWDLAANRLEILRPGPARMPVEGFRRGDR